MTRLVGWTLGLYALLRALRPRPVIYHLHFNRPSREREIGWGRPVRARISVDGRFGDRLEMGPVTSWATPKGWTAFELGALFVEVRADP